MKYFQSTYPIKTILINPNDNRYIHIKPMYTHLLFTSCSKEHYQYFKQICQQYNVTLHGPLFACLILAIQHTFFPLKTLENDHLTNLEIEINYNMRKRLSTDISLEETVGYYIGVNSIDLSSIPLTTKFWSLADYCSKQTHKKLLDGEVILNTCSFADIIDDEKNFLNSNGILSEMNYSNLGKYPYDINQYKNVNLDGIHLINSNSIYHSSTIIYITTVKQIDLSLAHHFENLNQAKDFLNLYKYLIELSINIHKDMTLKDIFNLLNVIEVFS